MPWYSSTSCRLYFGVVSWLLITKGLQPADSSPSNIRFILEPKSRVFIPRNRQFEINCSATGEPHPQVSWTVNGKPLKPSKGVHITKRGLSFIGGVRELRADSPRVGIFRCLAESAAGVLMSRKVELDVIYLRNVSLRLLPRAVGKNARLECLVSTNQPVAFTWFKDNKTIDPTLDGRITVLPTGVLQIRDFTSSDQGLYSCRVENEYEKHTSPQLRLIGQSPNQSKLHIYPGKVVNTIAGSDLVIECVESGSRQSNISWEKLSNSGKQRSVIASGVSFANLEFHPVRVSYSGEYFCQGKEGTREKVVLSVQASPSFQRLPPAALRLTEGDKLMLECETTGNPKPSVTWFRNGQTLVASSRVYSVENNTRHRLIVRNITLMDKGVYQCEAENSLGSSVTHTVLYVAGKVSPPSNVKANPLSATEVNVSWCSPSGYWKQNAFYSVHYQDGFDYHEIEAIADNHATFYTIKYLKPYTEYFIYVKMFTSREDARRSEVVTVRTLEKEPTGPPLHVNLKSYTRGTLDVTWLPPHIYERNGPIIEYHIIYSMAGRTQEQNITVTKNFYTLTVTNLVEEGEYFFKIAAKTHAGLGPFTDERSCRVSRESLARDVLPAPTVFTKAVNTSILVSVKAPSSTDVAGYRLTYRNLKDEVDKTKEINISERSFNYTISNLEKNSEYAIYVKAKQFDSTLGRPAIVVVPTKKTLPKPDSDTRPGPSISLLPPMGITCHHAKQSTALVLKWQRPPFKILATEYRITYFLADEQRRNPKSICTDKLNLTLSGLSPGSVYEVEIQSTRRDGEKTIYSSILKPESGSCSLPEKKPDTPPLNVTCKATSSAIVVTWLPPTKPNGQVTDYKIQWLDSKNNRDEDNYPTFGIRSDLSYKIKNVKKHTKYTISIFAVNSEGSGPAALCYVNTTMVIVATTQPSNGSGDGRSGGYDDIKLGIIIGCIISLLFVVLLAMFVLWSDPCGCRQHKPLTNVEVETTVGTDSLPTNRMSKLDTTSTEVSDASSKHYQLLQKYFYEEASKESDRGLGMTPKNSRLCLDSERIPFLPRTQTQDHSTGASFDSQDSGIQGLYKTDKGSASSNSSKDAQKFPPRSKLCVKETVC